MRFSTVASICSVVSLSPAVMYKSNKKNDGKNMQFRFTDSEREAVVALKESCDKEGIEYKNLFELAKYVLVTESMAMDSDPEAAKTRLQAAMTRLKKRNKWIKKHGMHSIDAHSALLEIDKEYPGFIVNRYTKDENGCIVVAHHHAYAPADYVHSSKANLAKYLAAEQYRMDLGAADMEEARRGIAMVSITDGQLTKKKAVRYLRLVSKAQENLKDMHSNRIKQIYSQVPSLIAHLISPAKMLLPTKLASRISIAGTMEELHTHLEHSEKQDMSVNEWAHERLAKYQETLEKLKLEIDDTLL